MIIVSVRWLKSMLAGGFALSLLAATDYAHAGSEKIVFPFRVQGPGGNTFGAYVEGGLIDVAGLLYGTTRMGGAGDLGAVFKLTTYGREGLVYSFMPGTKDGDTPAGLISVGGTLFGVNVGFGATGHGNVFKLTRAGTETVLYAFKGGSDGAGPLNLIYFAGALYGVTAFGGSNSFGSLTGFGTIFKVTMDGAETVLHSFQDIPDGASPSNLIDVGGILYGTTYTGGANGRGTVFSVTAQGSEKVLYSFQAGDDGNDPSGGLINVGGTLYGTTFYGGANGAGTVFSITPAGAETVLYSFQGGTDGARPSGSLINVGGTLYGTTQSGGSTTGGGTVFSVTTAGAEKVVYAFAGGTAGSTDGFAAFGSLINVNGIFYGTTASGGKFKGGTVFAVTP